jgi:hypothetical protein
MNSRLRLRVQDLLNRMIDEWPPMLRLVVRASLPAPGLVGRLSPNRSRSGCRPTTEGTEVHEREIVGSAVAWR